MASELKSDAQKVQAWKSKLGTGQKPRLGVAWSGSRINKNDHKRSIELEQFKTLLDEGANYVCLQKEIKPQEADQLKSIKFFGLALSDFSDTAALVELMDLVITVDTSMAHLAAALGKPVWLLLPFNPDWRWFLSRADSPWYASMRLFRQPTLGDWTSVLKEVKIALRGSSCQLLTN